jgi:hypothetical protein
MMSDFGRSALPVSRCLRRNLHKLEEFPKVAELSFNLFQALWPIKVRGKNLSPRGVSG